MVTNMGEFILSMLKQDTERDFFQEVAKEILDRYGRLDLYINTVGVLHIPDGMQPGMFLHDNCNFLDKLLWIDNLQADT